MEHMKLVANIQLKPSKPQAKLLAATLECCNDACNWMSQAGFEVGTTATKMRDQIKKAERKAKREEGE